MAASEAPSVSAAPSASAPAIAVDSLVEVIVTDLIVRSEPGVEAGATTILPDRLTTADRAYVVAGPVSASGYAWYEVGPLRRADGTAGPFGWIAAASREGEGWVRPVAAPCPTTVDLAGVLALQPLERLACFGGESLELSAPQIACGAGGGPWTFEPNWLLGIGGCGLAIDASAALLYRVPPGVTVTDDTPPVIMRGHFDDPAAAGCTATSADPSIPAPGPDEAVLMCRTEFVVDP